MDANSGSGDMFEHGLPTSRRPLTDKSQKDTGQCTQGPELPSPLPDDERSHRPG